MRIHVVKSGESIYSISRLYRVPWQKIVSDNELQNPNQLVPGQTLVILEGTRRHVVVPGDSLYSIAQTYRLNLTDLIQANPQIANTQILYPGQIITIPPVTINFGTIAVNGYAFPNIDMEVLNRTLPHLTYLSIFNYEVRADGSLD